MMSDVTIGGHGSYEISGAPQIGDRVYIGIGARILGNIRIADDVVIGANAVVTKDILEPGTTWGVFLQERLPTKVLLRSFAYLSKIHVGISVSGTDLDTI